MRGLGILLIAVFAGLVLYAASDLPNRGDLEAPANRYLSPYYIENAYEDAHTNNMVTVVLADYRGYDTLGETVVIFAAGLAALLILRRERPQGISDRPDNDPTYPEESFDLDRESQF
ncbi:MAG: hypothetical protein Kow00129_02970 [Thermoleophilia bacterium]